MNAPVDVLSVMDRMIESNRRAGIAEVGDFAELIEARAAVAELIEIASDVSMYFDNCGLDDYGLGEALARVQGGQS